MLAIEQKILTYTSAGIGTRYSPELLSKRNSDTLFILGSGPSIADINAQQWQSIRTHDTIGFNWWLCHPFVPTFFMFQGVGARMLDLLSHEKERYRKTTFLVRGSEFANGELDCRDARVCWIFERAAFFIPELPMCGWYPLPATDLFDFYAAQGNLNHGVVGRHVPKWRSTLGLLLSLSYQMGYSDVVLAGCDMFDSRHFWDEDSMSDLRHKYSRFLPTQESGIKALSDHRIAKPTLVEYASSFASWANEHGNYKLWLLSDKSLLSPMIPIWPATTQNLS